jgi:DNA repair exonuclease SbcCD nuclease subunit
MKYVFTSDWHVRNDNPINRLDDFQEVQRQTLFYIAEICKQNNADLITAGDLLNKSKQENMQELLNDLYDIFKGINVYYDAGNHDLLYKAIENFKKCNIGLLANFSGWFHIKNINNISFFDYGEEIKDIPLLKGLDDNEDICILHKYCEIDNLPEYINEGITAKYLLEKYNYNVFVVGDNHKSFVYEDNNRFVFNTGCITRQSLNEKDYKPSIILFDTETRKYEQIYLPDNQKNVFKEEQASKQIKRENRVDSFIKLVGENNKITFNYEDNIKKYCQENKIEKEVINELDDLLEEE